MTTLPESTALGAIQAVGWICGRCPRCSTSTDAAPAVHGAACFRLGPSRQPGGSTIDRASAPPPTLGRRSSVAYRSSPCSRSTCPCETPPPGEARSDSAPGRPSVVPPAGSCRCPLDDDLPEQLASHEILVCLARLLEGEEPVDDRSQPRRNDGPVHGLEARPAPHEHTAN